MNKEGLCILIAHSHLFSAFPALLRRERINLLALEYIRNWIAQDSAQSTLTGRRAFALRIASHRVCSALLTWSHTLLASSPRVRVLSLLFSALLLSRRAICCLDVRVVDVEAIIRPLSRPPARSLCLSFNKLVRGRGRGISLSRNADARRCRLPEDSPLYSFAHTNALFTALVYGCWDCSENPVITRAEVCKTSLIIWYIIICTCL